MATLGPAMGTLLIPPTVPVWAEDIDASRIGLVTCSARRRSDGMLEVETRVENAGQMK